MLYRQIPPPTHLQNYIRYFWVLESDDANILSRSFRTIAEGSPGLIFQSPDKGAMYQFDVEMPSVFLYGQSTSYGEISFASGFSTIGICFYPDALRTVFGLDADELTNTCASLEALSGKMGSLLSEQLMDDGSNTHRIRVLSAYLSSLLDRNNKYENKSIQYLLSRIIQAKGGLSLDDLRKELQVSERSLERKFRQFIGIAPKLFCRISRFQASLNELRFNRYEKLSDIAYENEYADQSHFIRSFKEFAGCSPLQYQKQLRLQTARERMLMDGLDATSAAYEVGYESVSQFSREYSRFFGQPPIRDIKALRESNVAEVNVA